MTRHVLDRYSRNGTLTRYRNGTLTRYRYERFWDQGTERTRFTTVSVIDRTTHKVISTRPAGSAVPEHVRQEARR